MIPLTAMAAVSAPSLPNVPAAEDPVAFKTSLALARRRERRRKPLQCGGRLFHHKVFADGSVFGRATRFFLGSCLLGEGILGIPI